jgi:hypothetical protein
VAENSRNQGTIEDPLDAFDALPADAVRTVSRSHVASAEYTATT